MTFYERFVKLCSDAKIPPSTVAREIGLSNSSTTYWKRGSTPKGGTLQKLADYFGVSIDYLLGATEAVSQKIVNNRQEKKMLITKLSALSGIPVDRLQVIESGFFHPTSEELLSISNALDIPVTDLTDPITQSTINVGGIQSDDAYSDANVERKITLPNKSKKSAKTLDMLYSIERSFFLLNDDGQKKAVERVQELTEIPKYQRQETPPEPPQAPPEDKK